MQVDIAAAGTRDAQHRPRRAAAAVLPAGLTLLLLMGRTGWTWVLHCMQLRCGRTHRWVTWDTWSLSCQGSTARAGCMSCCCRVSTGLPAAVG
jgi:hypothetical protein